MAFVRSKEQSEFHANTCLMHISLKLQNCPVISAHKSLFCISWGLYLSHLNWKLSYCFMKFKPFDWRWEWSPIFWLLAKSIFEKILLYFFNDNLENISLKLLLNLKKKTRSERYCHFWSSSKLVSLWINYSWTVRSSQLLNFDLLLTVSSC